MLFSMGIAYLFLQYGPEGLVKVGEIQTIRVQGTAQQFESVLLDCLGTFLP